MTRKNGISNETSELLESLGISREDLASALGVKRTTINAWVVRDRIPWQYRNQIFVLAKRAKSPAVPGTFLGV